MWGGGGWNISTKFRIKTSLNGRFGWQQPGGFCEPVSGPCMAEFLSVFVDPESNLHGSGIESSWVRSRTTIVPPKPAFRGRNRPIVSP